MGSSISVTTPTPACFAASQTALFSTSVTPEGTHITTFGLLKNTLLTDFEIKYLSIAAVISKSAITPSLSGRTAIIEPGVLPIISFALFPTAKIVFVLESIATTEGSRITIPFPFRKTSVFAVPKSIPISLENIKVSPFNF